MSLTYSKELLANARAKMAHTFKLEINGFNFGDGKIQMNGMCGPKTAKKLWDLVNKTLIIESEVRK